MDGDQGSNSFLDYVKSKPPPAAMSEAQGSNSFLDYVHGKPDPVDSDNTPTTFGGLAKQAAPSMGRGVTGIAGSLVDAITGRQVLSAVTSPAKSKEEFLDTRPKQVSEHINDFTGLNDPSLQPHNRGERLVSGAFEALPSAVLAPGRSAAQFAGNLAVQGIAGLTGSAAAEGVSDEYKPTARLIGSLAGGMGASGVAGAASKIKNVAGSFGAEGQKLTAGQILESRATDADKLRASLDQVKENVPGSQPTTFQATGDMGIGSLERSVATQHPAEFMQRRAEQNAARVNELEKLQQTGDPEDLSSFLRNSLAQIDKDTNNALKQAQSKAILAADQLGGTRNPEEYGSSFRDTLQTAENQAREKERGLWKAIDPDNELTFGTPAIQSAASKVYGRLTDAAKAGVSSDERTILGLINGYGPVVPFNEITDLRSAVSQFMREELVKSGRSPTYARLSALRHNLEDSINDGVKQRFVHETQEANRSQQPPNQDMISRLNRWSGQVEPTREPIPGPTWDADAADRLAQATAATRQRAQTFGQNPIKPLLKREGAAGPFRLPESAIPSKIFHPGESGYQDVAAFRSAVGDNAAMPALTDYAVSSMRRSALRDDGSIDPAKFASWQAKHQDALRGLPPALQKRMQDASGASEMMEQAAQRKIEILDTFKQGMAGKLIGATDPADTTRVVGGIFGRQDGVAAMRDLAKKVSVDPAAKDGLRRAVADHITNKFLSNTEAATSQQTLIRADQFQSFVKNNRAILKQVFSDQEVSMMQRIADDIKRSNRSINAVKLPGGSNTAQDITAMQQSRVGLSWMGQILGALGGWHMAGPVGAVAGKTVAEAGSKVANAFKSNGISNVERLIKEAMLDPKLAKELLAKASAKQPPSRALMNRIINLSTYEPANLH